MKPTLSLVLFCAILQCTYAGSAKPRWINNFTDDEDVMDQQDIEKTNQVQDEAVNVVTVHNRRIISSFVEVRCEPRSIPVRITAPRQFLITPTYVILNRCLGAGDTALHKCVAKTREKVVVKYTNLQDYKEYSVVMYNHLECTSSCVVQKEDCNPITQSFKNCLCNCNLNATYCNSIGRYFDSYKCQCGCKNQIQCPLYREWSPVTCQCECAGCIRDICKKAKKKLDTENCKCKI